MDILGIRQRRLLQTLVGQGGLRCSRLACALLRVAVAAISGVSGGRTMTKFGLLAILLLGITPAMARAQWSGDLASPVPVRVAPSIVEFFTSNPATVAASDDSGGAILVWRDHRPMSFASIYAQRIDRFGQPRWAANGILVGGSHRQDFAATISDHAGGAYIVWIDARTDPAALYAQHLDRAGTRLWGTDGVLVCGALPYVSSPAIALDRQGGILVSWFGGSWPMDIFAQRLDSDGQQLWGDGGVAVCTEVGDQRFQRMFSDDLGRCVIAWYDDRDTTSAIYVQQLDSNGAAQWPPGGVRVSSPAARISTYFSAVTDGSGGCIVAWSQSQGGTDQEVRAQRIGSLGLRRWTQHGVMLSGDGAYAILPSALEDGHGGAIVSWTQHSSPNYGTVAQRVDSLGASLWQSQGIVVGPFFGGGSGVPVSDGAGGVLYLWDSASRHAFAQRLALDGTLLWSPTGVEVARAPDGFWVLASVIVPDNSGGGIAAWQVGQNGSQDQVIHAQAITSSGTLAGPGNVGVPVSRGESGRLELTPASPNPTGAATTIRFRLGAQEQVSLTIFDLAGRRLRRIMAGSLAPGAHSISWDGRDHSGGSVGSGVYRYRVTAGTDSEDGRVVVIR